MVPMTYVAAIGSLGSPFLYWLIEGFEEQACRDMVQRVGLALRASAEVNPNSALGQLFSQRRNGELSLCRQL